MLPTRCTVPKPPLYGTPVASHTVLSEVVAAAYAGFTYVCVPLPKSSELASYETQETAKRFQRHTSNDRANHYLSREHRYQTETFHVLALRGDTTLTRRTTSFPQ